MSDQIPIGSPPAPPGRHAAPPGWYSDPTDRGRERYWDGWQWSRNTRDAVDVVPGQPANWPLGPTNTQNPAQRPGAGAGPSGNPVVHPAARSTTEPYPGHGSPDGSAWSGYRGYGLQPTPTTADGAPLASWGARLLAAVIDVIGVAVVSQAVALPFSRPLWARFAQVWHDSMAAAARGVPSTPPTSAELASSLTATQQGMYVLILCAIGFGYYALCWRYRSATLGQSIAGIRVVLLDHGRPDPAQDGQSTRRTPPLPWSSVLARTVIWVLPAQLNAALWLFTLLDGLWPLWNPRRQAIHDLIARTQVIRVR